MYKIAILYFIGELKVPENNLDPQQNALFREIDEELRNDKMKAFWEKYRFLIAAVIVCAILGAVAFETFKYWREQLKERDAAAYTDALTLALEGKNDLALSELEKIAADNDTGYAQLAQLKMIPLLELEGKKDEALSMLLGISKDKNFAKPLREVAIIALAQRMLNQEKPDFEELQNMLAVLANKDSAWSPLALELSAMAYIKAGDKEKAKERLQLIVNNSEVPAAIRDRIRNMIAVIDQGSKK